MEAQIVSFLIVMLAVLSLSKFVPTEVDGEDAKVEVIRENESCERVTKKEDYVVVNYTAKYADDGKIFDKSEESHHLHFRFGDDEIFPVWEQSLMSMCVGDIREISVHAGVLIDNFHLPDFQNVVIPDPSRGDVIYRIELLEIWNRRLNPHTFNKMDANGDDKITKDEMKEFILSRNPEAHEKIESGIHNIFDHADQDDDGHIAVHEFPRHDEF